MFDPWDDPHCNRHQPKALTTVLVNHLYTMKKESRAILVGEPGVETQIADPWDDPTATANS